MDQPWLRENWFSSPQTFAPEVQAGLNFPKSIEILDLSLDENGEGMSGARLSEEQKLSVAQILDEMGIHRIGVLGYPRRMTPEEASRYDEETQAAKRIARVVKNAQLIALATSREDIDRAATCGVQEVVIRKYVSHVQDAEVVPVERKIADFIQLAEHARSLGLRVAMMAQGITRADLDGEVREILTTVHDQFGLDELCLTDTHGVGTPPGYMYLVRRIKEWIDVPLHVHCHNHLGLGVANACLAAAAGASVIHTTVHGLGHFSGLAPLEEVAVALSAGFGVQLGLNLEKLYQLSQDIQRYTGIHMPPHKPVVGARAFVMSNDVFYNQQNIDRSRAGVPRTATLPYLPEMVGNAERVYLGEGLSRVAIMWKLELIGRAANAQQVDAIYAATTRLFDQKKREVSEEEFLEIVEANLAAPSRRQG